jgi:hypothetical protein
MTRDCPSANSPDFFLLANSEVMAICPWWKINRHSPMLFGYIHLSGRRFLNEIKLTVTNTDVRGKLGNLFETDPNASLRLIFLTKLQRKLVKTNGHKVTQYKISTRQLTYPFFSFVRGIKKDKTVQTIRLNRNNSQLASLIYRDRIKINFETYPAG